jgi:Ca2+ insensitive EF hand
MDVQPFVTELDLRLAQVPQASIDYLTKAMPAEVNEAGEREYDYLRWLDEVFEQGNE